MFEAIVFEAIVFEAIVFEANKGALRSCTPFIVESVSSAAAAFAVGVYCRAKKSREALLGEK